MQSPGILWMIFKILILFILFALIKAIVPRYRYDQLMRLGWKIFLPFSLIYVVLQRVFWFILIYYLNKDLIMKLGRFFKTIFIIRIYKGLLIAIKEIFKKKKQLIILLKKGK